MKVDHVTNLKRQTTKILAELRATTEPVLIMENGRPSAHLVDMQEYEFMQRQLAILEALSRGERAIVEGRTYSQSAAKEKMAKLLK